MAENPIDPDISLWILEFLLRQPISDSILLPLAAVLPISDNNIVFPKLFLLRKLQFEVTNCVISENVLDLFDKIYELDQCLRIKECPDSLKKAFCAVAVECTVGCLKNCNFDVKGEYFDMVKRVWRGRVRKMEGKGVGLVSGELVEWRGDFEASVFEENVCLEVVERSKGIDATEAVRFYLKDEKSRMGPSFLELVSKKLKRMESEIRGGVCSRKRGESDTCGRNDGQEPEFVDNDGGGCDKGKVVMVDMDKSNSVKGLEHGARKRSRLAFSTSRGAKIADVDDSGAGPSCNDHLLGTPEVEKVHPEVGSSRLGVHGVVNNPSREAIHGAESGISILIVENKDLEATGDQNLELSGGQNRGQSSEDNIKNAQSGELNVGAENIDVQPPRDQNLEFPGGQNKGKSSEDNAENAQSAEANVGVENMDLEPPIDRNLELPRGQNRGKSSEDNAENAQSGEANVGVENMDLEPPRDQNRGKHSGVDNTMNVQPGEANAHNGNCSGQRNAQNSLMERNKTARTFEWDDSIDRLSEELPDSRGKAQVPKQKRKKKRFSIVEEDALRAGVQRYGVGSWKAILNAFSDIFVGRTEVDLKDKWRNMTRPRR